MVRMSSFGVIDVDIDPPEIVEHVCVSTAVYSDTYYMCISVNYKLNGRPVDGPPGGTHLDVLHLRCARLGVSPHVAEVEPPQNGESEYGPEDPASDRCNYSQAEAYTQPQRR